MWEALQRSHTREAYQIRRMLTEDAVRASDKRAQFVGIAEYEAADRIVLRDLFESDDGGWLQDPALLDRLVAAKLEREAEADSASAWLTRFALPRPRRRRFAPSRRRTRPSPRCSSCRTAAST